MRASLWQLVESKTAQAPPSLDANAGAPPEDTPAPSVPDEGSAEPCAEAPELESELKTLEASSAAVEAEAAPCEEGSNVLEESVSTAGAEEGASAAEATPGEASTGSTQQSWVMPSREEFMSMPKEKQKEIVDALKEQAEARKVAPEPVEAAPMVRMPGVWVVSAGCGCRTVKHLLSSTGHTVS